MIDKNEIISVTNRDNGTTGYTIPDLQITRNYQPGETKDVTMDELRKLSYLPGGMTLLKEMFIVNNPEAVAELLNEKVEPEYYYSKEDVENLLLAGTLDQLKDCLDFAPEGVKELVKEVAVKLEINDLAKRQAIFEATGFNISRAIEIKNESKIDIDIKEEKTTGRRAAPMTNSKTKERKTEPPVYKIIK